MSAFHPLRTVGWRPTVENMSHYIWEASIWLYVIAPLILGHLGKPSLAGLAMIAAAVLPWVAWTIADEPLGPGEGFTLILSALMLALGFVVLLAGLVRKARKRHT